MSLTILTDRRGYYGFTLLDALFRSADLSIWNTEKLEWVLPFLGHDLKEVPPLQNKVLVVRSVFGPHNSALRCFPSVIFSGESWDNMIGNDDWPPILKFLTRLNQPDIWDFTSSIPRPKTVFNIYWPYALYTLETPPFITTVDLPLGLASRSIEDAGKTLSLIKTHDRKYQVAMLCGNPVDIRRRMFEKLLGLFGSDQCHSLGKVCNTGSRPETEAVPSEWRLAPIVWRRYNFGLAFENRNFPGYVTEKIFNVWRGGGVPIYWGSDREESSFDPVGLKCAFNPKAYIDLNRFGGDIDKCAKFVYELSRDSTALDQMRSEPWFKPESPWTHVFIQAYNTVEHNEKGTKSRCEACSSVGREQQSCPWHALAQTVALELAPFLTIGDSSHPDTVQVPIKVINLGRRPDRWINMKSKLDKVGLKMYERADAIDGKKLLWSEQLEEYFSPVGRSWKRNPYGPHRWQRGVIGCSLSHIGLWKEIAHSDKPFHLILEDDIRFDISCFVVPQEEKTSRWNKLWKVLSKDTNWDVVHFGTTDGKYNQELDSLPESHREVGLLLMDAMTCRSHLGGAYAYALTPRGAAKLLDALERHGMPQPVDFFLYEHMDSVVTYKVDPSVIYSDVAQVGGDSDIQFDNEVILKKHS